jgi:ferritin-like metal-binding protein YciE
MAMYESLITVAEAAGDTQTAALAREIQQEEEKTAQKIWSLLPNAALSAFERVTTESNATAATTR